MTNRLRSSKLLPDVVKTGKLLPENDLTAAHYTSTQDETPTALFAPLHYEPNYAYPLLVWLHGANDDESQLKRIMPLVSMRNYVAVAPRAPQTDETIQGKPVCAWSQSGPGWTAAEQCVFDAIERAQLRFNISPRRIFVAGFDGGGTMAFRLAMDYPQRFAGVLSLGGRFPSGQAPLKRITLARHVPIFLACGRDSLRYTSTDVCDHLKLFHSAGLNVSLRQYPCGHEMVPAMLADMDRWIMEQITSAASTRSEAACIRDFDLFGS